MSASTSPQQVFRLVRGLARVLTIGAAAAVAGGVCAWSARGSIAIVDWLPAALVLAALLVTVLAAGVALRPTTTGLVALGGLLALAAWAALSLSWSPLPTLARDEALLTLTYALTLALPLVLLRTDVERLAAAATVAATAGAIALGVAVELAAGADPGSHFAIGRLEFPIAYANAQAAVLLIGLWPALAVAARRAAPIVARALGLAVAAALLAGWLATQSKGGAIGLAVSAVAVFALSPARLRLALPALVAGACAAALSQRLTAPYRADEIALDAASAGVGRAILLVFAAAGAIGVVYALLDRRLELRPQQVRIGGWVAAASVVAGLVLVLFVVVSEYGRPDDALRRGWNAFATYHEGGGESSHLVSLGGSNRYDFWKIALAGARDHPVAGVGARGFQAEYLREGRSEETPARAHSLHFDILLEGGAIGLVLLLVALLPALLVTARAALRGTLYGAAALGGTVGWLAHAGVDWTWTFAATGIPFFLLLGIGASEGGRPPLPRRFSLAAAAATAVAAVVLLAPAWLSARLTQRALLEPARAEQDLRLARRLDPLSVQPLLAEAAVAPTRAAALAPLREAKEREPRSVAVRYRLGVTLLELGRRAEARRELEAAAALAPREELIRNALARAATPSADG
jgi:O-Antigen ligase